MKFIAITILAFVACTVADPISLSGNNIGDIVTVEVNANLTLDNKIEQNIAGIIAALLNQQSFAADEDKLAEISKFTDFLVTPERLENIKDAIAAHIKEAEEKSTEASKLSEIPNTPEVIESVKEVPVQA